MTTTSSPLRSLVAAPDKQGHCEHASYTWAPPAIHTHSNHHMQSLSGIPEVPNPATTESFTVESPVTEHFPPLYTLPRRSSNSYEEECKTHHESGVCNVHHCQGAPRQHDIDVKPLKHQRTNSWNMEDQKRLQHMKFISGGAQEAKTF